MRLEDDRIQRIRSTVDAIPRGAVATYGQIAAAAGLAGRARLVGKVLSDLEPGSSLPWHRVLAAGGRIALTGRAAERQLERLAREGVRPTGRRVDLERYGWRDPG